MTAAEEALEQGWRTPAPTFFTEDQLMWARKCHASPWVVVRRTLAYHELDVDHPAVVQTLGYYKTVDAIPKALKNALPHSPRFPRPMTYLRFGEYR